MDHGGSWRNCRKCNRKLKIYLMAILSVILFLLILQLLQLLRIYPSDDTYHTIITDHPTTTLICYSTDLLLYPVLYFCGTQDSIRFKILVDDRYVEGHTRNLLMRRCDRLIKSEVRGD